MSKTSFEQQFTPQTLNYILENGFSLFFNPTNYFSFLIWFGLASMSQYHIIPSFMTLISAITLIIRILNFFNQKERLKIDWNKQVVVITGIHNHINHVSIMSIQYVRWFIWNWKRTCQTINWKI